MLLTQIVNVITVFEELHLGIERKLFGLKKFKKISENGFKAK